MKCCFDPGCGPPGPCEACDRVEGTSWQPGRTLYHHEPGTACPNAAIVLCDSCADDYNKFWDEMWSAAQGRGA